LLREGLDLPEVSLVAIMDADKEGFLRAERSLIQTIGRAARHVRGQAILYGDQLTASMEKAISETAYRRAKQMAYNEAHGLTPQPVPTQIKQGILEFLEVSRRLQGGTKGEEMSGEAVSLEQLPELIGQLEQQMQAAAQSLEFETAAQLRDRIKALRDRLMGS